MEAALGFVPEHGWTEQSLREGAQLRGFTFHSLAPSMFPEGPTLALVQHFVRAVARKMRWEVEKMETDE